LSGRPIDAYHFETARREFARRRQTGAAAKVERPRALRRERDQLLEPGIANFGALKPRQIGLRHEIVAARDKRDGIIRHFVARRSAVAFMRGSSVAPLSPIRKRLSFPT
jgi:hypothetical protein